MPELALTSAVVQELLEKHRVTLMESLAKMLAAAPSASAPSAAQVASLNGKKAKKAKKEVDPNAPPKEKRAPNSWILFAMRVEKLVRAAEAVPVPEGESAKPRLHTIVIKQFAASLKEKKAYDEWTDDEVTEALSTWTPPEVSKQAAAKAAKAAESTGADEDSAPAAEGAPATAEKPKRQWSEEAKASAALKRAATKAAKAAGGAPTPAAEAAAAPAPTGKPITIKPKAAPAPPAEPAKPLDLSFFAWTHEGKSYYTNDRGDVVTEDFEWVGRFDGKKIDGKVAEPEDMGEATLRE
jgi:hypothetical protein